MINDLRSTHIYSLTAQLSPYVVVNFKTKGFFCLYLCLFLFFFYGNFYLKIYYISPATHAHHTQGGLGKWFLARAKCVMYTDSPTDSSGIRRLARGIIIYYHTDCWAVKMTLFHPGGHAWMDGRVLMDIIFLNSFQLFIHGYCLKCSSFIDVTSVGKTLGKRTQNLESLPGNKLFVRVTLLIPAGPCVTL